MSMLTPVISSPQTPYSHHEPFDIDFNERINFLHDSLLNHLETISKSNSILPQIFHLIPILFRFLRKNLRSQQKLSNEYTDLSNSIQKIVSICAQYLHDRHDHENELLSLKDQISRILGQIGYTQYSLEQYWTIIHRLEDETERLQILLSNPQLLQSNQRKFQTLQETQKIKLNRLIKENEKVKFLIDKQTDSMKAIQTQIEVDVKELQELKPIFQKGKSEEQDVNNHWTQIEQQMSHLKSIMVKSKTIENEHNDRTKTTKFQYNLGQKRLNALTNIHEQTNQKLLAVQTNENIIKEQIQCIKTKITQEQTRSLICRNQMQNLRRRTHELELSKRYTHHLIKSEEHTNLTLTRRRATLENGQLHLHHRLGNLTGELTTLIQRTRTNERTISIKIIDHEGQQSKITAMEIVLKKILQLNNNLDSILQANRFLRANEGEKLRSMKQISFQKRKELLTHKKRLQILSSNERHTADQTIRNTLEIRRLNDILHDSNTTERYFQLILRRRKLEMMKREKQRASLNRSRDGQENQLHYLTKKNQFIENELQRKIEHFRSLNEKLSKEKHDRIVIANEKQFCIYFYRQRLHTIEQMQIKTDQLEKISNNTIDHIIKRNEENEQLKENIQQIKQQIVNMMSRNQRQIDECSLLNEKIRLYTHLNDLNQGQEECCSSDVNRYSSRILDLERENKRLVNEIRDLQKKRMMIISSHHEKRWKKENLDRINRTLSHRPTVIRDNPMRTHIDQVLDDYMIYVNRLMQTIRLCVQWREKLAWINQLYSRKIEQIRLQRRVLLTPHEMFLRYQINSQMKQCKAMRAESRVQTS